MPFPSSYHSYVPSPRRYSSTGPTTPTRLLIGLPNTGKSTLFWFFIDNLEPGQGEVEIDTEAERLAVQNDVIETVDLHMGEVLADRYITNAIFTEVSAVIFLLDFTQYREGWDKVRRQLHALDDLLGEGVPIVVLANKIDLIGQARALNFIRERLQLDEINSRGRRPVGLFGSSLVTKVGFPEGLWWLATEVLQNLN